MKDYCQHRSWYLRRFRRLFFTVENVCDPEWLAQTLLFTADIFKAFPANSSVTALAQTYRRDVVRSTEHSERKKKPFTAIGNHLIWDVTMTLLFQRQGLFHYVIHQEKAVCLPVEVRFVFIHIDVVERILSEPGVDGETVLVGPFGYWWQCYGLVEDRHTGSCTVYVYRCLTWIQGMTLSLSCLFSCLRQEVVVSLITSFWCLFHWDEYHQIAVNQYIPVSFLVYFTGSLLSRPQREGRSKITCIVFVTISCCACYSKWPQKHLGYYLEWLSIDLIRPLWWGQWSAAVPDLSPRALRYLWMDGGILLDLMKY